MGRNQTKPICARAGELGRAGLKKPVGTGPVTAVTGLTGSGIGRLETGPNLKFKFEFQKMEKFLKILQGATNLMVSNFLKISFI